MIAFTQNLMHSLMNLVRASQNNGKWDKIWKNQIITEKHLSTLSII